jgi:endonuclease YncB( thermonuclease family)
MLAGRADARDWQTFTDCRLVEHPANDGDSFHVQAGDKPILVRLYFVDCPETAAATDGDAKRVREQALHFGVIKMSRVLHYGEEARTFVAQVLSKPFTVRTVFATAFGRSSTPRVYGMITTADGKDLGSLLVEKGLARAFGTKRKTPDGMEGDGNGDSECVRLSGWKNSGCPWTKKLTPERLVLPVGK